MNKKIEITPPTVKEILTIQEKILYEIGLNNEFNLRLAFEVHRNASYLNKNFALNLIEYNFTKIIILELTKLYNPSEDFSLHKLFSIPMVQNIDLPEEFRIEDLRRHKDSFKRLQKKFKELSIKDIRDEYIAHLDKRGEKYSLKTHEISTLVLDTQNFYNLVRLTLIGSQFVFQYKSDSIAKIIGTINQHKEIFSLVRGAFHSDQEFIKRDQIWDIFMANISK